MRIDYTPALSRPLSLLYWINARRRCILAYQIARYNFRIYLMLAGTTG